VTEQEPLKGFAPRQVDSAEGTDQRVKLAVVKEQAAQRAEELSRTAEDATRVSRDTASRMRAEELAVTDRDTRETAVQIATERRRRAIAARVAAEFARKAAEAARKQAAEAARKQTADAKAAAAAARAAQAAAAERASSADDAPADDPPSDGSPRDDSTDGSNNNNGNDGGQDSGGGSSEPTRRSASPVPGAVIGTPFGATGLWARYHTGLDFRSAGGTPIRAVKSGVVLYAGNKGNWSGNHVAIKHSGGYTTMSSHMSSMSVRAGQNVRAGQVIGRVGATGRAFGAHLHFELYPRGVRYGDIYSAVNPVPWLRSNGVRTRG
jgi:murein DD-endopeptidase MepM/ murein hydrolase activator NlpD